MKFLCAIVAFAVAVSVTDGQSDGEAWKQYKIEHGKNYWLYFDGGLRDSLRKRIFLYKNAEIQKHNNGKFSTFKQAHNQFTDMRPLEWRRYLGVNPDTIPSNIFKEPSNIIDLEKRASLPDSLDHRTDDCMPEVKDQGPCGSCWAFAAITPLEFAQCKKTISPTVLSGQQLVDCDRENGGCNGGWYTTAWDYIKSAGGSSKETLFPPYNARRNFCQFRTSMVGSRVSSHAYITPNNVVGMQEALQNDRLLAVAITVVDSFMSYGSGIYDAMDCDSQQVNHAVVIVGWGIADGVEYWICRNSWGPNWGEGGYFRIERGVNKCKIENYAAYVLPV